MLIELDVNKQQDIKIRLMTTLRYLIDKKIHYLTLKGWKIKKHLVRKINSILINLFSKWHFIFADKYRLKGILYQSLF